MGASRRRTLGVIAAGFLSYVIPIYLILTLPLPLPTPAVQEHPFDASWSATAPYVDNAIFKVITRPDDYVHALLSGEIDDIPENIPVEYMEELKSAPDIAVTVTEGFSYAGLAINCQWYPYSMVGFRRALAFAIDKGELAALMYGELGYALDNPIPPACGVWHTNRTNPSYKLRSLASCKAELDAAGFVDVDHDGYVEAPDGKDFTFGLLYTDENPKWEQLANASKASWDQAGIPVQLERVGPRQMSFILSTVPRDYDGALVDFELDPPETSPLAIASWSSNQTTSWRTNFLNWRNGTYDYHVTTMLSAADFGTVLEAAYAAQELLVCEVPMIVLCGRYQVNAHRTNRLSGWVISPGFGTGYCNLWVPRQVRLRPGDPQRERTTGLGGTFHSSVAADVDSQNPLISIGAYDEYLLSQVYGSLMGLRDPRTHLPTRKGGGLAFDWVTTELADGLQFDFMLYRNATWHDGTPVTAEDVTFSYNYIRDHRIPIYLAAMGYLESCAALDDYHVRIIANDKSYWSFEQLADWVILPERVWKGIVSPLSFSNPAPVGFGPFRWYRHDAGACVELRASEVYHKGPPGHVYAVPATLSFSFRVTMLGVTVVALVFISSVLYLRPFKRRPNPKG